MDYQLDDSAHCDMEKCRMGFDETTVALVAGDARLEVSGQTTPLLAQHVSSSPRLASLYSLVFTFVTFCVTLSYGVLYDNVVAYLLSIFLVGIAAVVILRITK